MLKYYGFSSEDHTTFDTLFTASNVYPETALIQLLKNKAVGINLCRTLIAKPTNQVNGYMSAGSLSGAFMKAKTDVGWFGGYAN